MERVPVSAWRVIGLLAFGLTLAPCVCGAAPPPARALTKARPGSLLKAEKAWEEPPDLRGEGERARDRELATHYSRMAQLDVLATLAGEARELGFLEWVDQVRRKELERHHLVMMRQQRDARAALATGTK